ncbi:MAG: hypothetical protein LBK59_03765 [Bifidobacteriaceae bacterium]|jgi:hypothetical protein|nr:hypothetical protein [Bifidobacteriaceae bacterium]
MREVTCAMEDLSVRHIASEADVDELTSLLLDPRRTNPVVVVSTRQGESEAWIDAERIAEEVGDLAQVWVVPTSSLSWRLAGALPAKTQVYGGAGRVYPADPTWQSEPRVSPLRFVTRRELATTVTDHLISDAMSFALASGVLSGARPPSRMATHHTGVVTGIIQQRAFVELDNGAMATICPELTVADVQVSELVEVGQQVSGMVDPVTKRLDVRESLSPGADAMALYNPGDVILAQVVRVGMKNVTVRSFPGIERQLTAEQAGASGELTDLFSPGEVVRVRLVGHAPLELRMDDITPSDDARPAPSLLPGGPPWIRLPPPPPPPPADDAAPAASGPADIAEAAPAVPDDDEAVDAGRDASAGARGRGRPNPRELGARVAARKAGVAYVPPSLPSSAPERSDGGGIDRVACAAHAHGDGTEPATDAPPVRPAPKPGPRPFPPRRMLPGGEPVASVAESESIADGDAPRPVPKPGPRPAHRRAARPAGAPTVAPVAPAVVEPAPPELVVSPHPKPGPKGAGVRPGPAMASDGGPAAPPPQAHGAFTVGEITGLTSAEVDNLVGQYKNRAEVAEEREAQARERADGLRRERDDLSEYADQVAHERNELQHQGGRLRTKLRDAQSTVRHLRKAAAAPPSAAPANIWERVSGMFVDPDKQLRWEISMAWTLYVSPEDKDRFPLPDYDIGPDFATSVERLQGVAREKVLTVIVNVLTNRAKDSEGRNLHRLRSGSAGGAPTRKRDDGAVAMRVALQRGTPAARQLHFWRLSGGRIELHRVGVHDAELL